MKTKLIFGVIIFGMVFLALGGVVAEDLEQELSELEQELKDAGFEWLMWAGGLVGCGLWGGGLLPTSDFLPAYKWDAFDLRGVKNEIK